MTSGEIKETYSMQDILMRYGIKSKGIKKNISCPFHKDTQPSMQIFKDGFKCHSCNEKGDIFYFVMKMENITFRHAYESLGGTYEEPSFESKMRVNAIKHEIEMKKKRIALLEYQKKQIGSLIGFYMKETRKLIPFSDKWCIAKSELFILNYAWDEKYIKENEVDIGNVYREHTRIKSEYDTLQ